MSLSESLLQSQPNKFGLWPSVWKLLRLRARIMWNNFKRAKLASKIGTIFILLLILGGMVFLFWVSSMLLRFIESPELAQYIDAASFLDAIPTMVLTMAFFLMIMTNFGVLLQSLYLSHDMDFLVTSPLPMRAVFVAKLLEAILPTFVLFCAASLPVLFGLGTASGYNPLYFGFLIAMLALLALAASGMASILVMAVVRVVPARRVAEVLGFVGAMVSILCGQSGNIVNAMDIEGEQFGAALGAFATLNTAWSPLAWAGRGLLAIGRGDWLPGLGLSLISLVLFGAVFASALYAAEQLYYTGWSSMQGSPQRKRSSRSKALSKAAPASVEAAQATLNGALAGKGEKPRAGWLPAPLRAMVIKDALLLRRDPRNLSQLFTPLIIGFVMIFSTQAGRGEAREALAEVGMVNIEFYFMVALSIFVGWMLMLNLASLAFTREGKSYWMLKSSPVHPWHLLGGKYIVSYLPAVAFSVLFLVVTFALRGVSFAMLPFSILVVLFTIAGANAIALAFGVAGANLEWDSPQRQRLSGASGCLLFIAISVSVVIYLALFLGPPIAWQIVGAIQGTASTPPVLSYILGLLLGATASLATTFFALRLSIPRLAKIGEPG